MPFYEALAKVMNDHIPMRRPNWPEDEYIIYTSMMSRVFKGNTTELRVWSPSEEDLVASDWEIYDRKIF